MAEDRAPVVFFDLGDTLGTPILSPPPYHLTAFDVFDYVLPILQRLKELRVRLGVISNTGDEPGDAVDRVLEAAGIRQLFAAGLLIYSKDVGQTKGSPAIFNLAAERAGLADARHRCLYVGEDAKERSFAMDAGLKVVPHPLLVEEVLAGESLRYVRITVPFDRIVSPWREALREKPVVPLHVTQQQGTVVYAITSQRTVPELIDMQFTVELLGDLDAPLGTELYILRDDAATRSGFLSPEGQSTRLFADESDARMVVSSTSEGIVVALPVDRSLDDLHFENALHGHTVKLIPDPLLLEPYSVETAEWMPATAAGLAAPPFPDDKIKEFTRITGLSLLGRVEKYSGKRPVSPESPDLITSRHIRHPGNAAAVAALAVELQAIGQNRLTVRLPQFTHAGITLHNVEAELPGASPELVLVTAHLDSTAANSTPYDPQHDVAPGADDDASGVAAVLTIAERLVAISGGSPLPRTIRFVLFNAEEHGLVGSKAYARHQRALNAPIVGVLQMDMIGYNKQPPQSWEVHAGFSTAPEVENRSVTLAELIRRVTQELSPRSEVPQLYTTGSHPSGDPAQCRSDHSPFQAHGYAACLASEDFFVGPEPGSPHPEENPNYHQKDDVGIHEVFAADIARTVAGTAWLLATVDLANGSITPPSPTEVSMPATREFDTRRSTVATRGASRPAAATLERASGRNRLTAAPVAVPAATQPAAGGSLVDRAIAFVQTEQASLGFGPQDVAEFVPDLAQRTSSGSAVVHLHQHYRGVPVFEMARTVRFNPNSEVVDAVGDNAAMPPGFSTEPTLAVTEAALKAAQHLANTGTDQTFVDQFGETYHSPTVDIDDFQPQIISGFALPPRPTVLDKGPFENPIPAHLVIFYQPQGPRLAWHIVLTLPEYTDQYVLIVSADGEPGEILYCRSTVHRALARGNVFEFSPGVADRRVIDFPRPLSDYPAMPTTPLVDFPRDWVTDDKTIGNATRATLNVGSTTLTGTVQDGVILFDSSDPTGDDQKLLNIFYFCNYMHDFLFILGFDESSGNFQQRNFTSTGLGNDPVRARAHSGPVNGTANMATGPDGLPPLMNMGLVSRPRRHTALDADVVFHEFVHGLTNRLVGGPLDTQSLEKLQSAGMGEAFSDYFALTAQNFFRTQEKVVVGDWVVDDPAGIRRAPYDDNYPFRYGDLSSFPINPRTGRQDEHDIGEVWCAALMMATRRIRTALGDDQAGYRLAWQMIVDGLKLSPANPTFLQGRDDILRALDDLKTQGRISPETHKKARKAGWEAFAHFGMGVNAFSDDPDDLDGIIADTTLPSDL